MRAKPEMKPSGYTRTKSNIELRRNGTHSERLVCSFAFVGKVPPLRGSINELVTNNPGLAPWAMKSVALSGLFSPLLAIYLVG